jgi:diguanylate cyclase (GGDEF)-like protein
LDKAKIRYKPLVDAVVIILITLLAGSSFVIYNYNVLINEAKSYISEITELSANNVSKKLAINTYSQESFSTYIGDKVELDDESIIKILQDEMLLGNNAMMRVSFAGTDGKGYTVRDTGAVNRIDISNTEEFKRAIRGEVSISSTTIDNLTRMPVNVFTMPVFKNNQIVGIHRGISLASSLEAELMTDYFGGEGFSYIVDADMNRVIDSNYTDVTDYLPFGDISPNEAMLSSLREAMSNSDSGAMMLTNSEGKRLWVSYRSVGIRNWYLLLAVPYSYVTQNPHSVLAISLVVLIVVLIAVIAFGRYLNNIKRENEKEFNRHVYYDELTGLLNKNGFALNVPAVFDDEKKRYALIFIDVDNFRTINELFGYEAGTDILKKIAVLIGNAAREGELAARLSGDDFVLLIAYKSDDEITERMTELIKNISACRFDEAKTNYNVVAHLGIYKLNRNPHILQLESYIDKAKLSLATVSDSHTSSYAFYDEVLQQRMRFDAELEKDVRDALKDGDFKVYIQPKYDAKTRKLAGGEALIRWQHKTKGFLTPNEFVPLFERDGIITELDMYVYDVVCRMQRKWLDEGYTPVPISVNQSRLHLYHSDYISRLKEVLAKYRLPAKYVELEITENIALSSGEVLENAVKQIHQIGFTVSMDDFGSGESSLNILKDIDIDVLKLDRMFFLETENNVKARQIIKSVIDMAGQLKISTVAEGVETEDQLKFLQDAGCDLIQGFLFGKPMPYDEFEKLFKSQD